METTEAWQIYVTTIALGSPAESKLIPGDVILGVDKKLFSDDPRTELGKAILRAEATDGVITLTRWRDKKTEEVKIEIPVLGSYSATAPFHCSKSQRILNEAAPR